MAVVLFAFVLILLPYGPGVTFDSVSFFQVGENFWSGFNYAHMGTDGQDVFASHRFPLYPLILGLFTMFPFGAIVLQILLFSIFSFLFFRLLEKFHISIFFGFFVLTFPIVLSFYALWTEGLFMVLSLFLFSKMWDYQLAETKKTLRIILLLIFLLCLTRLVGLALSGSVSLYFLFQKKWREAFLSLLAGLVPFICWTILGIYNMGETARTFTFHSQNEIISKLIYGLGDCLIPASLIQVNIVQTITGVMVLALPLSLFFIFRKSKHAKFLMLLVAHFYGYLILLIFCILFIDVSIPLETRTLLPANFTLIVIFVFCVYSSNSKNKNRFVVIPILIFGLSAISISQLTKNGVGYTSKEWTEFKFTEQLKSLSAETIYTNDQHAIWYFSRKKSIQIPQKSDLYTKKINENYSTELGHLIEQLLPEEQIVWIRSGATAAIYPTYEEIKIIDGLDVVYDDWLCVILEKRPIIRDGFNEPNYLPTGLR